MAKKKVVKKSKKTVTQKVKKTRPVVWYVVLKDTTTGHIEIEVFFGAHDAARFAREMEDSPFEILCGWGE